MTSILEKLKHRPVPVKRTNVDIVIPEAVKQQPVVLQQMSVIDKTKESLVDMASIKNKLKEKRLNVVGIKELPVNATERLKTPLEKQEDEEEERRMRIQEAPIIIKKTQRRVKLVERPIEKMTPAQGAISISVSVGEGDNLAVASSSKKIPEKPDITAVAKSIKKLILKPKPAAGVLSEGPVSMVVMGDTIVSERLPRKVKNEVIAPTYYMNNRARFLEFVNALFQPYREQLTSSESDISCDKGDTDDRELLTHQKIVRDYLDIHTPYRGLLLYHGLGSGKTCASIAIAEGLKTYKQVIVLTPASLRMNYIEELKKCGDSLYKKNQYWEFISVKKGTDKGNLEIATALSKILSLPLDYIRKNNGAWMVNVKKASNYDELTPAEKVRLDAQLNEMIRAKYRFINYNGLRKEHLKMMSNDYTENPFDNAVIIVDEAHNLVSRIVNKLKNPGSLSMRLYEYIMSAENAKVVMMSGTPVINYPNEIAILFNLMRGYIRTWYFPVSAGANLPGSTKLNQDFFKKILGKDANIDMMEYNATTKVLTITRNPFGFSSVYRYSTYKGVSNTKLTENTEGGQLTDASFERTIIDILSQNNVDVQESQIKRHNYKALPDTFDGFNEMFIDGKNVAIKNRELFIRRILGLTSYFRSAQEKLLPAYDPVHNLHLIETEMSDYQFGVYNIVRQIEIDKEENLRKNKAKGQGQGKGQGQEQGQGLDKQGNPVTTAYKEASSTYRIFSRACCNFVFPKAIVRPLPGDENEVDAGADIADEEVESKDGENFAKRIARNLERQGTGSGFNENMLDEPPSASEEVDDDEKDPEQQLINPKKASVAENENKGDLYQAAIKRALVELKASAMSYLVPSELAIYSPKFLHVLQNIIDPDNVGLHLLYSQFRTLEGIGILKIILETNGFAQFKIKQTSIGEWVVDMPEEDWGKPCFALYTGTETPEEKEIIRNIYNSTWKYVPRTIVDRLAGISKGNMYGEVIKLLMITASGAEGINLRNVRHVHIVDPYWHPVRTEQIIGRARRICSHKDLPEELRTVDVYIYLMKFSARQMSSDFEESYTIRMHDKSKIDNATTLTTDQALYEISKIKEGINKQILGAVKSSAFDCALHTRAGVKDQPQCFTFGETNETKVAYNPNISSDDKDTDVKANKEVKKVKASVVTIRGTKYAYDKSSGLLYDYENYLSGNLVIIGKLVMTAADAETGQAGEYRIVDVNRE
jgi:hypothetical protein